ncbi:MAG: P1 family peptidase [Bryobacteraceae bacterium]
MKGLTDIPGILVGHATDRDAVTGCTAILCPQGATAGADVRGSATGTSQLDLLSPMHLNAKVHGICLSGGSAFGLEAAAGVVRFLESKGHGFPTGAGVVPLVPAAILFDLGVARKGVRPGREMGHRAAEAATGDAVAEGSVGAGTGATVGKLYGVANAMKSGIGSATVWLDGPCAGIRVAALAAVNAYGDVLDPESGHILAGARTSPEGREFANMAYQIKRGARGGFRGGNTTLVVVATNARLSKIEANKLAQFGSLGVARTISPVWTTSDGDLTFALSLGEDRADLTALGVAAAEAVAAAVQRSVRMAESLGGVPGLR